MVNTITFIQASLQHSIAASSLLTRPRGSTGIAMALIQELWYHGACIRGLNFPGYTLYSAGGKERPSACILAKNLKAWMLPGFSCRDLVAVLVKYNKDGVERRLVVSSVYLPYDSEDPPPSRELEELIQYCDNEDLYLLVGCDSNAHHTAWGSTNCNDRGEALMEFLDSSNLEILNRGNEATFSNVSRHEVIDIILGSFRLLERITGWEVSSEPSLSDHRHILFTLWGSFREALREKLERGPEVDMKDEALGLAVHWIQEALTSAYEENCPLRPVRRGRKTEVDNRTTVPQKGS
jgi:hypothetical protein